MSAWNIGSAILIVGCLYFGYEYGFEWWLILLILFALASWGFIGFTDERKKLFAAQIRFWNAKAHYYEKKEGEK